MSNPKTKTPPLSNPGSRQPIGSGDICTLNTKGLQGHPNWLSLVKKEARQGGGRVVVDSVQGGQAQVHADGTMNHFLGSIQVPTSALTKVPTTDPSPIGTRVKTLEGTKWIRLHGIDYDTDGEDVDLPKEIVANVAKDFDVAMEGADLISDKTGWCVNDFQWEEMADPNTLTLDGLKEAKGGLPDPREHGIALEALAQVGEEAGATGLHVHALRTLHAPEAFIKYAAQHPTLQSAWDACTVPDHMLWLLRETHCKDEREFRQFSCWCAKYTPLEDGGTTWDHLTDPARCVIQLADRYAFGWTTDDELQSAVKNAEDTARNIVKAGGNTKVARNILWAAKTAMSLTARDAAWVATWTAQVAREVRSPDAWALRNAAASATRATQAEALRAFFTCPEL